jgi:hypothetical protein
MHRSASRPITDLTAYDLYLRALGCLFPMTKERISESLELLDRAIAIHRHYGIALSWSAMCHLALVRDGWTNEPETSRRKAHDVAGQARKSSCHGVYLSSTLDWIRWPEGAAVHFVCVGLESGAPQSNKSGAQAIGAPCAEASLIITGASAGRV